MKPPKHHAQSQSGQQPSNHASSQAVAGGFRVEIKRHGDVVEIIFTAGDEYTAIELYEHLVQSTQKGTLHLDLGRV
jgi:hypothetical protein